jgi:hypothetical protein
LDVSRTVKMMVLRDFGIGVSLLPPAYSYW